LIFTILPRRVFRWLFTTAPQRRFFNKCWVWLTMGQIVEIPRVARKIKKNKAKLRLKLSPENEKAAFEGYNGE
jgi:hypothetical protein